MIQDADIPARAKEVGAVIVNHWNAKLDRARLKLETIMAESGGKSRITVIRAVNDLIAAGIFERVRTGRSSILRLGEKHRKISSDTDSRSITSMVCDWPKAPPKPKTGTRFREYCPADISTEDSGERYTKDQEFYLGF